MTRNHRRSPRAVHSNERGVALIMALFFAVMVLAYAASIVSTSAAVHGQKRYLVASQRALDAAEAGVHHLIAVLNQGGGDEIFEAGLEGVLQGDEESDRAVRYRLEVAPAGDDGIDNDLDGAVDEADEFDMIEVVSTGSADRISRAVRVTLVARYRTPTLPATVYLGDPNAAFDLKGNAFLISGFPVDVNGQPDEDANITSGVGVGGDPAAILEQIEKKAKDNVIGAGGTPSVAEVAAVDFNPLIEDAIRSAGVVLESGTHHPENEGDWGTLQSPQIVYGKGSIHLSGNSSGAGILAIDGDLKISGSFKWVGMIIVRGQLELTGGGSVKRLLGGLVVDRRIASTLGSDDDSGMTTTGTVDLLFSPQAVARISKVFASYSILNWREAATPKGGAAP